MLESNLLMRNTIFPLDVRQRHVAIPIIMRFANLLEGHAGHEAGRFVRLVDFGVELVNLFEGETFAFVDPGMGRRMC